MPRSIETIARLNDEWRQTGERQFVITDGVTALGADAVQDAISLVRTYTGFDPDNDPMGERDFGTFDLRGHRCLWKIDYYAHPLDGPLETATRSDDPADPKKTIRVLTILLAEEF